ncbi:syntaxin-binding protein 3 [Bombina bombina]|uniref:syntaxin-binding protein 3 n=1 Tax=Bombina bombina TaxID=8345 RepID=UPI00235AEF3B|nr:syntaxin-binding protein 3 [Bombina bombina]
MAAASVQGLKSAVWHKIKTEILDDGRKAEEWKILLLDHFTTKLLTLCCKMTDLLQEGITVVEDLFKIRQPVEHMKAIYFISPNEKSVDCLVNDFKNKSPNKYKAAYVYFADVCPDHLFNKLKSCTPKAIKRCKEINISFFPQESQVFTLNVPDTFHLMYNPDRSEDKESAMQSMAQQIVTLCATLEENPGVRYKKDPLGNAEELANFVEEKLVQYYKTDEKDQFKEKSQSQLLILDRGFDPVSTVLHELTFQAMVYDLLPIENDVYKYSSEKMTGKDKEARLDESDELWVKIRHRHIADVLTEIPKLVKEISNSKKETEAKLSISNLSNLMKKMPHFRKHIRKQALHLSLAEDCMEKFKANLERLCKVEQDLALGTDAEGQKVKEHMRVLLPVLLNKDLDNYDKIRAILLYIFVENGTTQENLDRLIQHAKIESDGDVLKNWKYIGVPIVPKSSQRKPTRRDRSKEETFQLSRWTPVIKDVIEDNIENKLDQKEWPYCSECPAAWNGSGAVSARQKHNTISRDERKSVSKLIVFVIGGLTYSEIRCAYEVTQANKYMQVLIGSTHLITPKRMLDDIKSLSKPHVPKESFTIVSD